MKISHALAAVLLMGSASSLTAAVLGKPAEVSDERPPPSSASLEEASGEIGTIDGEHQLITVGTGRQSTRLQIDQTTTIFVSGRTGTLSDLSAGQRVRATFELRGRALPVAEWIELSDAP